MDLRMTKPELLLVAAVGAEPVWYVMALLRLMEMELRLKLPEEWFTH